MVIVRLMGGLGNQMFQYAAARRVALSNNVPLKLDISWFARSPDRAYALRALSIEEAFASPDDLRQLAGPSARGLGRLVFRLRRRSRNTSLPSPRAEGPASCRRSSGLANASSMLRARNA